MVDGVPGLAPPKHLDRDEILARLACKERVVDIEGLGPLRIRSLSVGEAEALRQREQAGEIDETRLGLLTIVAACPDLEAEDVEALLASDMTLMTRLIEAVSGGDAPTGVDFRGES